MRSFKSYTSVVNLDTKICNDSLFSIHELVYILITSHMREVRWSIQRHNALFWGDFFSDLHISISFDLKYHIYIEVVGTRKHDIPL